MDSLIAIQRWLYGSMTSGLSEVANGGLPAVTATMALAVVFGAVHALMPGHGKTVLVSYHLGQPGRLREGLATGMILALTHVGTAIILVLAGVAVISRAFASAGRTPAFEAASAVLITAIGAFLLWRALQSSPRTHRRDGKALAVVTGLIPCPLTTFIMTYALSRSMLGAGLAVTAAMAVGMIATIGGIAAAAVLARNRFMGFLARTETWRYRLGRALEVGSSAAVLGLGLWSLFRDLMPTSFRPTSR
jgi:nickel/cobalt transporter (NicO) family protein